MYGIKQAKRTQAITANGINKLKLKQTYLNKETMF